MPTAEQFTLPHHIHPRIAERVDAVLARLARYHRYRVEGLEHIPARGPALLVVHHSLATYDIALLGRAIFAHTGRLPRALADRLIFKIKPLATLMHGIGGVQGEMATATRLLQEGELVMVAPGGMREALRPSREKYQVSWQHRLGFARLAISTGVPVICAACPTADDIYTVYPNRLTAYFFKTLHLPLPVVRGLGLTCLPRPAHLTHFIAPAMTPPQPHAAQNQVAAFQHEVLRAMQGLLAA